jgi:hypothetical protein
VFVELLKKIAEALDDLQIPYIIVGGQAVLMYGEARMTRDIDITLGIGIDSLNELLPAMEGIPLVARISDVQSFISETSVLPAMEPSTGICVDFIFSETPFEREALNRANGIRFDKSTIRYASLEDLIVFKMFAGRPRDLDDVGSIIQKNPEYDLAYIEKWLRIVGGSIDRDILAEFKKIIHANPG